LLIVAFAVLTIFMLSWADGADAEWKNRMAVFSSVEAIVFTAVGWLFGREVHRSGAETARQDAAEAKTDSKVQQEKAAEATAKGMKLAGAVEALVPPPPGGRAKDVALDEPAAAQSQIDRVQQLARELYPSN
jgi:hypothetical protein